MRLRPKPKLFELAGWDMAKLATILGISLSQVYRIRQGKRPIHDRVIANALTAFPECKFEDLFYVERG